MSHWDKLEKVANTTLNLAKPKIEIEVEKALKSFLKMPFVQEFFKIHPEIMTAVLSGAIGLIPEETKRSPWGEFGLDMAKTIPREILRIVENQNPATAGTSSKTASVAPPKKVGAKSTIVSQQKAGQGTLLVILDKKLMGKISEFIQWFSTLTPEEQQKVEKYILSLDMEQIRIFVGIEPEARKKMLVYLKEEKVEEPVKKEKQAERNSVVEIFARSYNKNAKSRQKAKKYNLMSRIVHRTAGHPIDKTGRRVK